MIVIVDYGMGNLRSVAKAIEAVGGRASVTSEAEAVARAQKLVVPGVGAFPAAMRELAARRLAEPITAAIARGVPYLGICLGLQLLFDSSDEGEGAKGLGVVPGVVARFPAQSGLKIPHMGWNQVSARHETRDTRHETCPLLQGIPEGSFVYFVHSYYAKPNDAAWVALESRYGVPFAAMVWRANVFATQFHPEKSQALGLQLLKNFVNL